VHLAFLLVGFRVGRSSGSRSSGGGDSLFRVFAVVVLGFGCPRAFGRRLGRLLVFELQVPPVSVSQARRRKGRFDVTYLDDAQTKSLDDGGCGR
jgi:hypothetical protein